VVIRFTESSIDYEKTLAEAVKRAVARKPNLAFESRRRNASGRHSR